jgi:farnesyl-diphosphate farnesyltransferase
MHIVTNTGFVNMQVEAPVIAQELDIANSMGLFLQKTNIIRDYLEDYVDGRAFWPAEIWRKHATKTLQLGELALPENRTAARSCLNELITDALELIPDCLAYMDMCKHPGVFKFCAIPQVGSCCIRTVTHVHYFETYMCIAAAVACCSTSTYTSMKYIFVHV